MKILAIETSCDETACAIIETEIADERGGDTLRSEHHLLSEVVVSQILLHEAYGGVVPELASREHLASLPIVVNYALVKAGCDLTQIDAFAVTQGPGLKVCLMMGLSFVKGLALPVGKPVLGINHLEGHLLAPMMDNPKLQFPFLALIVSGGHTELVLASGVGDYSVLGRTIDDAAGEAFDKSAYLLGIPYPGGALLADLADLDPISFVNTQKLSSPEFQPYSFPIVMRGQPNFSFSGLKTSISQRITKQPPKSEAERAQLARSIQFAIVETLVDKCERAIKETGITSLAITGGVAKNRALRARISGIAGIDAYFPLEDHCTDNAAMIAYAAALRYARLPGIDSPLEAMSRWPLEHC